MLGLGHAVPDLALDKMILVRSRQGILARPVTGRAPMDRGIRKWPFPGDRQAEVVGQYPWPRGIARPGSRSSV